MTSTLIVVNYNTAERTEHLVEGVREAVDEVIVVDNASRAGDPDRLAALSERYEGVRFLPQIENLGYGAGANAGARLTASDVIIVANPDVEIDPHALHTLAAASMQEGVGLAAPRFLNTDGTLQRSAHRRDPLLLSTLYELCRPFAAIARLVAPDWHPTLYSSSAHGTSRDAAHVLGALMAIRRDAFVAVGGFDEHFFLYREETDLCRRLRRAGWRVRHVAEVSAVHEGGASSPDRRPTMVRPDALTSHYRYIAKHRGRVHAAIARILGSVGGLLWLLLGPKRNLAWPVVRWHFTAGRRKPGSS